ncbi:DUF2851 family protein [Flavobacterium urocaniciphilum]|uniref:DUF2851 domain-containing protein n=1 Tax=Flavobacterium urocaniciphilum TaxID=1299341 RepID=A0A1H9AW60_9FLAO|nr:DUF2851 family protein [Flavobacterium urocaniciphilum]SEP80990.1 Protein of unknown function [Flavobacterium urocaniciphilum]
MHEEFLHYLWVNKKLPFTQLKTHLNENLEINHFGQFLQNAGPDIFNAQISIDQQKWAGNIEIHIKSSDWYAHHHEKDSNYDNVILHVVWENDSPVFRKDNSEIPTLELKNYIPLSEINNYQSLIVSKTWINCENHISEIDAFIWNNWLESLFLNRLERKSEFIDKRLLETNFDWEAVFFEMLAKNFGLNTNGECFYELAKSIPFSIIRKESFHVENLEALFFGKLHLLEEAIEDDYYLRLKKIWNYLKLKYKVPTTMVQQPQFFQLRPDNFPTIRLSQLLNLFANKQNLFSQIILANSYVEIKKLLECDTSDYWKHHYNFSKTSKSKSKTLSKQFIDLLIINTIIPIKFCYEKNLGKLNIEDLIKLLEGIPPEKNSIIDKFFEFKVKASCAFETQSLLELKNEYCKKNRCLKCAVGLQLLKN